MSVFLVSFLIKLVIWKQHSFSTLHLTALHLTAHHLSTLHLAALHPKLTALHGSLHSLLLLVADIILIDALRLPYPCSHIFDLDKKEVEGGDDDNQELHTNDCFHQVYGALVWHLGVVFVVDFADEVKKGTETAEYSRKQVHIF